MYSIHDFIEVILVATLAFSTSRIVFHPQLRVCHKLTTKMNREIILGSSSIDDPPQFITVYKITSSPLSVLTQMCSLIKWSFVDLQKLKLLTVDELSLDDLQI